MRSVADDGQGFLEICGVDGRVEQLFVAVPGPDKENGTFCGWTGINGFDGRKEINLLFIHEGKQPARDDHEAVFFDDHFLHLSVEDGPEQEEGEQGEHNGMILNMVQQKNEQGGANDHRNGHDKEAPGGVF